VRNLTAKEITFSPEKALESVLYIASKLAQPTVHEVLKIRYFADKLHLADFGFMASGDDYVAMKFGPVATTTYNLLKAARGDQSGWIHPHLYALIDGVLEVSRGANVVIPLRAPQLEHMSSADIASLDQALTRYGNMPFAQCTQLSHDAAWQAAWDAATEDEVGQSPIKLEDIAATLPNAQEVIAHLHA
jgi:uncharacterized phage-associated protein